MVDVEHARAKREATIAARQAKLQEERETRHSEAREAYKAQQRAAYAGDTATFNSTVWPDLLKAFEQAAVKDPIEADMALLLGKGRYHGF